MANLVSVERASLALGLGFTFFSGAVEAWLVDALRASDYHGPLEAVLGRGQVVTGAAMLGGSVLGGVVSQATNLGVPFLMRVGVLLAMFVVAFRLMYDKGFAPRRATHPLQETKAILSASITHGLGNRPVRFMMLAAPFTSGVSIYVFYELQPFLLDLYGDPRPTRSPAWPRRSRPARRSQEGSPRCASGLHSAGVRVPCCWPRSPPLSCSRCWAWSRASGWRWLCSRCPDFCSRP